MSITERYGFPAGYREKSLAALTAALGTAPLYRSWRKFDPGPGAALDARYDALPELTKNEMRRHFPQGLVPNRLNVEEGLARDEIEYTFTSGSTGEKVVNLFNQKWWSASEAASWKLNAHTAGLTYPQRQAKLASSLNVGIHCEEDLPMGHRIMGETLYLNEKINVISWRPRLLERMARELDLFRPVVLEANPSLLARLAWWAIDSGRELYSPQVITFSYEYPSRIHLREIRQVFNSPLASSYGSTETGFVLMQCEDGLFHQNAEFCRLDYYPLAERHGGPDLGRILVTTFDNPWASILRFDMGDLVRLSPSGKCSCGRGEGYLIEAVEGRLANATFTTEGRLVTTMALDARLAEIPEIRDYHLEQRGAKSYELQLVAAGRLRAVLDEAHQVLESVYGRDGKYAVRAVGELYPGPSGKYRRTLARFKFDQRSLFENG